MTSSSSPSRSAWPPEYSVVIPVYESDKSVVELVQRLLVVFEQQIQETCELILVDDGSHSPETWQTCLHLTREHTEVLAIRLMRNYGKAGAVLCGLQHVHGRFVVTIDDDLQQRPEDIPLMVEHRDHDVVVANFENRRDGLLVRLTSLIKSYFDRLILGVPCRMSPLKLFKAEVARGMLQIRTPHPFIPALMSHVTRDFVAVVVPHEQGRQPSRYTFRRRLRQFSNLLINNSSLLLRCLGMFGLTMALGGFVYAASVVVRRASGVEIQPGWASLIVINLVFGGVILIALSIVGEYLIRILEGVADKPPYIVRKIVANINCPVRPDSRLADGANQEIGTDH